MSRLTTTFSSCSPRLSINIASVPTSTRTATNLAVPYLSSSQFVLCSEYFLPVVLLGFHSLFHQCIFLDCACHHAMCSQMLCSIARGKFAWGPPWDFDRAYGCDDQSGGHCDISTVDRNMPSYASATMWKVMYTDLQVLAHSHPNIGLSNSFKESHTTYFLPFVVFEGLQ